MSSSPRSRWIVASAMRGACSRPTRNGPTASPSGSTAISRSRFSISRAQRLLLVRDAIGVRPLYYFHTSRLLAFASEIKALLAHPDITPQPDDEGVADFMLIGSRPLDHQDLTCFQGVASVVPAHVVTVTPHGVTRRRYWDFDTDTAAAISIVRRIRRGIRQPPEGSRQAPESIGVSGRDVGERRPRLVLHLLPGRGAAPRRRDRRRRRLPASPTCPSAARPTSSTTFATSSRSTVSSSTGFAIEPRTGMVRGVREQVTAIEAPFVDYMWGVTKELHVRAAATGARSMLSGHWGDQMLFSTAYLIDLLRGGAWRSIWRHTKEYARYFGDQETAMRRRRPAARCREIPRAARRRAAAEVAAASRVRAAAAEAMVFSGLSRGRAPPSVPSRDLRSPFSFGARAGGLHRGAIEVPRAVHGMEQQGRRAAWSRRGLSLSRSRPHRVS